MVCGSAVASAPLAMPDILAHTMGCFLNKGPWFSRQWITLSLLFLFVDLEAQFLRWVFS